MGTSVEWALGRWAIVCVALLAVVVGGAGSMFMTFMSYAHQLTPAPSVTVTPTASAGVLRAAPLYPVDATPTPSATAMLTAPTGMVSTPPPSIPVTPGPTPALQASPLVPIIADAVESATPASASAAPATRPTRAAHPHRRAAIVEAPYAPLELPPSVPPEPGSVPLEPEFVPQFGPADEDWPQAAPEGDPKSWHPPPTVDAAPAWSPPSRVTTLANHLIVSGATGLVLAVTGVAIVVTRRRRW
jgi:hypothetical protein